MHRSNSTDDSTAQGRKRSREIFQWLQRVARDAKLPCGAARLAIVLADHLNGDTYRKHGTHIAFPKQSTLARKLGISERTVIRAIKALEARGYLAVIEPGRRFDQNQYRLAISEATIGQECHPSPDKSVTRSRMTNLSPKSNHLREGNNLKEPLTETRSQPRSPEDHHQKDSDSRSSSAPRSRLKKEQPAAPTIISETDFLSEDGTVYISSKEIAELEAKYPDVKNIRGLAQHSCRTWLAAVPGRYKKERLLTWLENRQRAVREKAEPQPEHTGHFWRSGGYAAKYREREEQSERGIKVREYHSARHLLREAGHDPDAVIDNDEWREKLSEFFFDFDEYIEGSREFQQRQAERMAS